jgi:tRNA (cytidine/uridine-2'-O-)-methyltransferase
MDDRQLKRAGLDYHEYASVRVHADWASCLTQLNQERLFALTTSAANSVYDCRFQEDDAFVFGSETAGLPKEILDSFKADMRLRLPMQPANRSLNLSNAVAVTVFEAWRQLGFAGGK